tara:strand:+ start:41 stop:430 length:390 start_codon:yes stop_codon:yes gene_type:complete
MAENFSFEIISPDRVMLTDKADSVTIPSFEGEMTILPDHISIITFLRPGIIKISTPSKAEFFVEEGTVEFSNNNLTILSSTILDIKELSKEKISKMIEDCKNQISKDSTDDKKNYIISHKLDVLSRVNL